MAAKPGVEFESPFLSNEVLARKSDRGLEARAERLAWRSPFLSEPGFAAAGEFEEKVGNGVGELEDEWPVASGVTPVFEEFDAASGERHVLLDAFYLDERDTALAKSNHPIKSFFNRFTRYDSADPKYETASVLSAFKNFINPLRDSWAALTLLQTFDELLNQVPKRNRPPAAGIAETKQHFEAEQSYFIFVPPPLRQRYAAAGAGPKPRAKIALFFGVNSEINLFGLRSYFSASTESVLIGVPGIESGFGWDKLGVAWGIGITTEMIKQLLAEAGVGGMEFTVEVIAGYSTGYRGVNETIINKLVDLGELKRLVYLDAFYLHDDAPVAPKTSPYYKKNTVWAVDTALTASASAQLFVYAYTTGGTPRSIADAMLKGPLAKYKTKTKFIDVEFKHDSVPPIADQLEKICLARLIQGGIDDYFERKDVPDKIVALIDLLPARGAFGTFGRTGFTDVHTWISATPQRAALAGFPQDKAFALVKRFSLLGNWTTRSSYNFRHRDFVQEICKECLLP
jgi:hypothetical protein